MTILDELKNFFEGKVEGNLVSQEAVDWLYENSFVSEDTGDFIEEREEDYEEDFIEYNEPTMSYKGMID